MFGGDIVKGNTEATPVKKEAQATEEPILGNGRAVGFATEYGEDGCVVVKIQVEGRGVSVGGKGECFDSGK